MHHLRMNAVVVIALLCCSAALYAQDGWTAPNLRLVALGGRVAAGVAVDGLVAVFGDGLAAEVPACLAGMARSGLTTMAFFRLVP